VESISVSCLPFLEIALQVAFKNMNVFKIKYLLLVPDTA